MPRPILSCMVPRRRASRWWTSRHSSRSSSACTTRYFPYDSAVKRLERLASRSKREFCSSSVVWMDFDFAASSRRRRREPVDALRELASLEFVRAQLQGAHGAQPFKTPPHASQHSVSTPDVRRTADERRRHAVGAEIRSVWLRGAPILATARGATRCDGDDR